MTEGIGTEELKYIQALAAAFPSYEHAHGEFTPEESTGPGKVKGLFKTVPRPISVNDWQRHIRGISPGLGAIPLLEDNTVLFAALDIDRYPIDFIDLQRKIENLALPFSICRSKSGGAHLYLHLSEKVPAVAACAMMEVAAEALGVGGSEIFPKQVRRDEPGQVGNWINLPFFGIKNTDRYAVFGGESQSVAAFLTAVERRRISLDELADLRERLGANLIRPRQASFRATAKSREGRNGFLFSLACSHYQQGLDAAEVARKIHAVNLEANEKSHPNFGRSGPLPKNEVEALLRSATKYSGRKPARKVMDAREALTELNESYAVTWIGNSVGIIKEYFDEELQRHTVRFVRKEDFFSFFANRFVHTSGRGGRVDSTTLGVFWFNHPQRRQFNAVVFAPGRKVPGSYNLWRGWALQPNPAGSCARFLEHAREVICAGNDTHYRYLMAWLADCIQNPDSRPGVAIVLQGGQGVGKGTFVQYFGKIFGEHFVQILQSAHLVGQFNAHLKGCLICFADEAFYGGDRRNDGILKGLITEETIPLEMKYRDATFVANRIRLVLASNNAWTIPAGLDARRFFVLAVPDTKRGDYAHFDTLIAEMNSGGPAALMHYLKGLDISSVNLRSPPQTIALVDQKHLSMQAEERFWFDRLSEGRLILVPRGEDDDQEEDWRKPAEEGRLWIAVTELHAEYISENQKLNERYRLSSGQFGRMIFRLCPEAVRKKKPVPVWERDDEGRYCQVTKYVYCYGFPPLERCRQLMEKLMGHPLEWPAYEAPPEVPF